MSFQATMDKLVRYIRYLSYRTAPCNIRMKMTCCCLSHSVVSDSATSWTAACQASLTKTNSQSLLKLMSIKSVTPSNHLILSSPSPAFNLFQHYSLLQWVSSSHWVAKALEFQLQHQSFQWIIKTDFFRIDWFDLLAVQGTLKSLLQYHSSKTINSSALRFL